MSAIISEMQVERAVIAKELAESQPVLHARLGEALGALESSQGSEIAIAPVSHEALKNLSRDCKAVVRTGECTPYSNIILYSGVTF